MTKQQVTKRLLVKKQADPGRNAQCAVIATLKVFAPKWKVCIISYLAERPLRYNELFRLIPNVSRKMLSLHLKDLETDGIIDRTVYDPKLQHVVYSLSEKGQTLLPLFHQLEGWGLQHLENVRSMQDMVSVVEETIDRPRVSL